MDRKLHGLYFSVQKSVNFPENATGWTVGHQVFDQGA